MSHTNLTIHGVVNVEVKAIAHGLFTTTHLVITDKDGGEVQLKMFSDKHEFPLAGVGIDTVEHHWGEGGICNYTIAEWLARTTE